MLNVGPFRGSVTRGLIARKRIALSATCFLLLGSFLSGCSQPPASNSNAPAGSGGGSGGAGGGIQGAGATFPAPIYTKWFAAYAGVSGNPTVNYQAVGSGAGYNALKTQTVDFAASDAPLSADEEKALPGPVVHVPSVGGAVVLVYNLPGVPTGLKLGGDVVADIFLGTIKTWNDPRIVSVNPGVPLPATPIQSVHRTDGSGTTYIFTHYLAKVSPAWSSGPGANKSVSWPVGLGGKGNPGVAAEVKRTPGGIGYVELAYAMENKLPMAMVKNHDGQFVTPTVDSTKAAIGQYVKELSTDIKTATVDAPGATSYPICSLTYILLYKNGGRNTAGAVKLWKWAMEPAQQQLAATLLYAPLPDEVVKINQTTLDSITAK